MAARRSSMRADLPKAQAGKAGRDGRSASGQAVDREWSSFSLRWMEERLEPLPHQFGDEARKVFGQCDEDRCYQYRFELVEDSIMPERETEPCTNHAGSNGEDPGHGRAQAGLHEPQEE